MTNNFSKAIKILRWIIFLTILIFFVRALIVGWAEINISEVDVVFPLLGLGLIFSTSYLLSQSRVWTSLLRKFGSSATWVDSAWLFCVSQLGKYIPGKIWIVAMRVSDREKLGVERKTAMAALATEHVYILSSGVIFYLITLFQPWALVAAFLYFLLLLFTPGIFIRTGNTLLKWAGREPVKIKLSALTTLLYTTVYLFTWLILSMAVWLSCRAVAPIPFSTFPSLGGAYALSFVIGFVTLFAPGGLGVREGTFVFLTATILPSTAAIYASVLIRLLYSLAEILSIAIVWTIMTKNSKGKIPLGEKDHVKWGTFRTLGPKHEYRERALAKVISQYANGEKILDAGCGEGTLLFRLARKGYSVIGLDQSEEFVESLRKQIQTYKLEPFIEVHLGSVDALPLADSSMPSIVCAEVLEHLQDESPTLAEFSRILQPDGHLFITVPANPQMWSSWDQMAGHYRRYSRDDITSVLRENGFRVSYIRSWGFPLGYLYEKYLFHPWMAKHSGGAKPTSSPITRTIKELVTKPWFYVTASFVFEFDELFRKSTLGIGWIVVARKIPY